LSLSRSKNERVFNARSFCLSGLVKTLHPKEIAVQQRGRFSERIAQAVTRWTGSSLAFVLACGAILIWLASGPFFRFSDTWQLVINTSTTIITFLMVFLIQRAQNKDMVSLHLKLNELVAAKRGASNRLINIEDLTEQEIATLHEHYQKLADMAKNEQNIACSHSIDEAATRHRQKATRPTRSRRRRAKKTAAKDAAV
jgi:low affinity Fe/Cu permease